MKKKEVNFEHYRRGVETKLGMIRRSEQKLLEQSADIKVKIAKRQSEIDVLRQKMEALIEANRNNIERLAIEVENIHQRFLVDCEKAGQALPPMPPEDIVLMKKALSLAVFDTILFDITHWADGERADSFVKMLQSVLFKAVYVPIMQGNEDYYLEDVPKVAYEIVKRGREYAHFYKVHLYYGLEGEGGKTWQEHLPEVKAWVLNDMLPMIYEARDPAWDSLVPFTLEEMNLWGESDFDKAKHFPVIFDAMNLTMEFSKFVQENSSLSEFSRNNLHSRIQPTT